MDRRELFLNDIGWLRTNIVEANPSEYELVSASGKLRRLLADGDKSLALLVNRGVKVKLCFMVGDHAPPTPRSYKLKVWAIGDSLNPDHYSTTHRIKLLNLSLDQFLGRTVMILDEADVSIRDLIRYLALVAGGVHAGTPKNPIQEGLQALGNQMLVGDTTLASACLKAVTRVAVEGLQPLVEAVQ